MPVEAAMSSIEPVNLPEPAAWALLTRPVDPVYPDTAKASGQRGSVVLQVLIGRGRRGAGREVPARIAGICPGGDRRRETVEIQALYVEWPGGCGEKLDNAEFQASGVGKSG